jgi:DsbC/DsbD-like thiol-disulfide interchange protein
MLAVALFFMMLVAGPSQETAYLKLSTTVAPDTAKPDAKISLAVDVTPKPGVHVYAPGQDGYIAITLTVEPQQAFTKTGKAKYPDPEKFVLPALNETQLVYNKPFRITQEVTLAGARQLKQLGSGPLVIKGSVRYQACNDTICFLPLTVPVTWRVKTPNAQALTPR